MLTKKQRYQYAKAIGAKLEEVGVEDKILFRVVKLIKVPNPAFNKNHDKNPLAPAQEIPEFFSVPRHQAVNLRRNIIKRLLGTGDRKAIEAFLKSDMSALKSSTDEVQKEAK